LLKKFAGLDSPAFAGAPTAQTPDPADDSERLANTEWVNGAIDRLVAPAGAATATSAGSIGLAIYAADSDTSSRDKSVTPAGMAAQFPASFSGNGYQKLPGGLIIQWGSVSVPASTTLTLSLPVAFSSAGYSIVTSFGVPALQTVNAALSNLAQYKVQNTYSGQQICSWIAIGK
jgi:hypothetical protein